MRLPPRLTPTQIAVSAIATRLEKDGFVADAQAIRALVQSTLETPGPPKRAPEAGDGIDPVKWETSVLVQALRLADLRAEWLASEWALEKTGHDLTIDSEYGTSVAEGQSIETAHGAAETKRDAAKAAYIAAGGVP